jgi:hypothetical protein
MNFKRRFACVFFLISAVIGQLASAQTIHLITIADTNDATIGQGVASNSKLLISYFREVSNLLQLNMIVTEIDGRQGCVVGETCFSCSAIKTAVDRMQAGNNDVVLFYYSGHGFRTVRSTSQFPSFYCSTTDPLADSPNLYDVSTVLAAKGARLVITVADTCNAVIPLPLPQVAPAVAPPSRREQQLRRLFLEYKGLLIMSSSVPGQFSWYYPNGGIFTRRLLSTLQTVSAPGASGLWKDVTNEATKQISVESANGPAVIQTPQALDIGLAPTN